VSSFEWHASLHVPSTRPTKPKMIWRISSFSRMRAHTTFSDHVKYHDYRELQNTRLPYKEWVDELMLVLLRIERICPAFPSSVGWSSPTNRNWPQARQM
jgi:hypothetical protein